MLRHRVAIVGQSLPVEPGHAVVYVAHDGVDGYLVLTAPPMVSNPRGGNRSPCAPFTPASFASLRNSAPSG